MLSSGTPVGTPVDLGDYIDPGTLNAYQSVIVPLTDLGVQSSLFNAAEVRVFRTAGPQVDLRFDVFQIEESGGGIEFRYTPEDGTIARIERLRFSMARAATGNATKSYKNMLGVTLSNGIVFQRVRDGSVIAGSVYRTLGDFYTLFSNEALRLDDGTDTFLSVEFEFPEALEVNSSLTDYLSMTINDTMTAFDLFQVFVLGTVEDVK
jgi:hypothetical protein